MAHKSRTTPQWKPNLATTGESTSTEKDLDSVIKSLQATDTNLATVDSTNLSNVARLINRLNSGGTGTALPSSVNRKVNQSQTTGSAVMCTDSSGDVTPVFVTTGRVIVSVGNGTTPISSSEITSDELSYLDGLTFNLRNKLGDLNRTTVLAVPLKPTGSSYSPTTTTTNVYSALTVLAEQVRELQNDRPYLCEIPSDLQWTYDSTNLEYYCDIPYVLHNKGIKWIDSSTVRYYPHVRTFLISGDTLVETYDSPQINALTGEVRVFSNSNSISLEVIIDD